MKEHFILIPFLLLCLPLVVIQFISIDNWKKEPFYNLPNAANNDIKNGTVKLITHSKRLYDLDQKYHFTKQFGFEYYYVPLRIKEKEEEEQDVEEFRIDEDGDTIVTPIPLEIEEDFEEEIEHLPFGHFYYYYDLVYLDDDIALSNIISYNDTISEFLWLKNHKWYKDANIGIYVNPNWIKYTEISEEDMNPNWSFDLARIEYDYLNLKVDEYCKNKIFNLNKIVVPNFDALPYRIQRAITIRKKQLQEEYRNREEQLTQILEYDVDFLLNQIDTSSKFKYVRETKTWMLFHYEKVFIELIKRLTDTTIVGISDFYEFPMERGYVEHVDGTKDDVFKVAGRANYLLTYFTGEDFGFVSVHSTPEDLERLQKRWVYWLLHIDTYTCLRRMDLLNRPNRTFALPPFIPELPDF